MFVTTKNPTMKVLMKVTMYMRTTMATDQHLVLRIVWSCFHFPPYNLLVFSVFFGLHDVAASSLVGLYDLVLVCAVSPFVIRSDVNPFCICYSVKFFHVGLCVSVFVHAHLELLVLEVALHDRSIILFLCGTQVISCFLEYLWFCRVSITSTSLSILQC